MHTPSQHIDDRGLIVEDSTTEVTNVDSGSFFSMANYYVGELVGIGILANGQSCLVALLQATDGAGTGKKTVTGKSGSLIGVDGTQVSSVSVDFAQEDLDHTNSFYFVGARITPTDTGQQVGVALLRMGARHKGDGMQE